MIKWFYVVIEAGNIYMKIDQKKFRLPIILSSAIYLLF